MSTLTACLQAAGDLLPDKVRGAVLARAEELRQGGMSPGEASRQAVADTLAGTKTSLSEVEAAMKSGATLYEAAPAEPPAAFDVVATRLDLVLRDYPDLMVRMDDMDEPMRARDFMAMVRAEADVMVADSNLMRVAAECALSFGS